MTVALTFDNLGEVADLGRGTWPDGEPLGAHFSVTRVLPRLRRLLDEAGARATFFVEGRNAELYPDALRELAADGHEIGCHGWCHEAWSDLPADEEARLLARARDALAAIGVPFVEVHLSNPHAREPFRHRSFVSKAATGVIVGLGAQGYLSAVDAMAALVKGTP